jgi:spore maturation protein CgeB
VHVFYASHGAATVVPNSKVWDHNIYTALADLGHKVTRLQYDLDSYVFLGQGRSRRRTQLESCLKDQIHLCHKNERVDLFFSYFDASCVTPKTIAWIRSLGIVTANWYCNASYQFEHVAPIAPAYDFCLVPERFRLDDYRRIGARPIYCQEAANPNFYKPSGKSYLFDVTFVGQRYGNRPCFIQHLADNGIRVRAFGPKWTNHEPARPHLWTRLRAHTPRSLLQAVLRRLQRFQRPTPEVRLPPEVLGGVLTDEAMVETFSRTKINLGFSACGSTAFGPMPIKQVRLRDFEIPMSGGFYLVEHCDELGDFFDLQREVCTFRDKDELLEKVRYFLAHDNERETIRAAGHARAHRDHTWQKRLSCAFAEMGLPGA